MRITPFVRGQLIAFAIIGVVALIVMGTMYMHVPGMLGIGRYQVKVELPNTGGIYQNANVTYRGVQVGKVKSVTLTQDGVQAKLSINSSAKIPANAPATVESVSAIGEQYVNFGATEGEPSGRLKDGSTVSGSVPTDIRTMLDRADALVGTLQNSQLRTVVDEAFTAFNGTGDDLQRLLDSMSLFVGEANRNVDVVTKLVDQAAPLLESQSTTNGDIRAWTRNVLKVTDQIRANDPQVEQILQKGPGVEQQSEKLFAGMQSTIPLLIDNLSTSARTMAIYHPNLRQILVLYPRLMGTLISAVNNGDPRKGAKVSFNVPSFQDPPGCTIGFLPASERRGSGPDPARELPPGLLCRVAHDSPMAVRGARNYPCAEFPGRRAPTPAECRDGYKPLNQQEYAFPKGIPGVMPAPTDPPPQGMIAEANPTADDGSPAVYATTYDPATGDYIGPDGKTYNAGLGTDGAQAQGGNSGWQSLITSTLN